MLSLRVPQVLRLARWADWGPSKLPFLAAATVLLASSLDPATMIAVAATVATGAAFGFALNEVADQEPDLKAGKPNPEDPGA